LSDASGNLIPQRWVLPEKAAKAEVEIIVNWLQMELPTSETLRAKAEPLSGWRNHEVYFFVKGWDWTARMFD